MFTNWQKFTSRTLSLGHLLLRKSYGNHTATSVTAKPIEKSKPVVTVAATEEKLNDVGDNIATLKTNTKNSLVAAAFQSLKEETSVDNVTVLFGNDSKNNSEQQIDPISKRISNANTVNGLLSVTDNFQQVNRNHALKVVSILAEWSSINRVKLSDFESDPRFIKLCRLLGRAVTQSKTSSNTSTPTLDGSSQSGKKVTGFRNDDLNTVLGVAGDDEAAKLIASISLPQMIKVMSILAQKKRRSTPLLRSLAFNLSSNSEQLDLKQCADLLFAISVLNFPDSVLIARICMDIQNGLLTNNNRSAAVGSIITSLGLLKYRDADVLESLTDWIINYCDICRPTDVSSLFLTLAALNYPTTKADILKTKIVNSINENDLSRKNDWLNHVWSLVVLNFASEEQINSVLNKEFIESLVIERRDDLSTTAKRKLLNINAASSLMPNYKGARLTSNSSIFSVPLVPTKSKLVLINGLMDTLKSLFTSQSLVRTNYDTKMGFVIDAELVMDAKHNPLPVEAEHKNATRLAIMVLEFHDMCQGTHQQPNGVTALAHRLLEQSGYRVITVPYNEFNTSDKIIKRVQYLEKKLKSFTI